MCERVTSEAQGASCSWFAAARELPAVDWQLLAPWTMGCRAIATAKATASRSGKATVTFKLSKSSIKQIKKKNSLTAQFRVVRSDGSSTVVSGAFKVA
jgi:hypothetical protein